MPAEDDDAVDPRSSSLPEPGLVRLSSGDPMHAAKVMQTQVNALTQEAKQGNCACSWKLVEIAAKLFQSFCTICRFCLGIAVVLGVSTAGGTAAQARWSSAEFHADLREPLLIAAEELQARPPVATGTHS